ncbi:YtxH domain-containing protein [Pedobacter agri]|uniref:YtxH domain-containing protein n=1 Tax=Pedobacter agri TaxID=454586 RepID=UPI00292CD98E|nr:YtxH domain-containing protein [Pedobacter agri]
MNNNSNIVVAIIAGLAAGAALGMLFAPDEGGETQDRLSRALNDLKEKIMDSAMQGIDTLAATRENVSREIENKGFDLKEETQKEFNKKIADA